MNVLLANTYHFPGGGDSTYTFNLAELLNKYGHNVAFFAMKDERNLPDPNEDLFVTNIDYRRLNQNKNIMNGFKVVIRSIYSVEARKKFHKLLKKFKPDIIHLQNIHHHLTTSIIFEAKSHNIPIIWTLHDYKLMCPNTHFILDSNLMICERCKRSKYFFSVLKRCKKNSIFASCLVAIESYFNKCTKVYDKVDYFLTPSLFLKKKLFEYGFPERKIIHVPHFLAYNIFEPSKNYGNYFLFMGKIERIKGIIPLIDACRVNSQVRLKIAGRIDEQLKEEFLSKLPSNVEYVGMKQGDELYNLIEDCIALVLPSICYENQPFSILEAFARGKPAIASNLGGIVELVGNNERGILVSPSDSKAISEAMIFMLKEKDETKKMGEDAYEYVKKEHTPEKHYHRLIEIYERAVK
ncbi:MAG: glycosyltransferase family 4 protein [bacterium]